MAIDNKEPYSRPYRKTFIEQWIEYRYSYKNSYRVSKLGARNHTDYSPELKTNILIRKDGITDINITIEL